MQFWKYLRFKVLLCLFVLYPTIDAFASSSLQGIFKPTGSYAVGYHDFAWINQRECPDPYFTKNNKKDYSDNNPRHCREIISTVYYPAKTASIHYSPYYRPAITMGWEKEFSKLPRKIRPIMHMRDQLVIQAGKGLAPFSAKKFPVILFAPGFGVNGNEYSNLLINLASHGYIIFVVQNTFIGDLVQLPNDHVIKQSAEKSSKTWDIAEADVLFVLDQLKKSQRNSALLPNMNLDKIALVGHSMGGMLAVDLAHKKPHLFQAAVGLDAAYDPDWSDPHAGFSIPFLHIHVANWATRNPHKYYKYAEFILSNNEYFVILSPNKNQNDYTHHMIFTDYSTLQYLPEVQKLLVYYHFKEQMQSTISNYLVDFFNRYLKNEQNTHLDQCLALSQDTRLVCGPGIMSNAGDKK
jgi:pimeloyl-ACP methyl ester carboxylesterase